MATIEGNYRVVKRQRARRQARAAGLGDLTYFYPADVADKSSPAYAQAAAAQAGVDQSIQTAAAAVVDPISSAVDTVSSTVGNFFSTLGTIGRYVLIGGVVVLFLWATKDHARGAPAEYDYEIE